MWSSCPAVTRSPMARVSRLRLCADSCRRASCPVPHSAVSSIEVRRWAGAVVVGAALTFGLASELIAYGWDRPVRWIPDLIVGLAYLIAGALALPAARGTGVLLAATGLAWYA